MELAPRVQLSSECSLFFRTPEIHETSRPALTENIAGREAIINGRLHSVQDPDTEAS